MTDSLNNAAPAGWYVDPMTRQHLRWWNGQAWTESVAPLPGTAPSQPVAPAPRVQQRFALGASDEQTQAAAADTQAAGARFAPAQDAQQSAAHQAPAQPAAAEPQPFVTQVPSYAARIEPERREPQLDAQPAIPWPAMNTAAQSAGQAAGHYMPQYGDALDLLKGTSLVDGSGGPDAAPAYRRSSGGAATDTMTDTAATGTTSLQFEPQQVDPQLRQQPPHQDVRPDLAFASQQQQEDAARAAEESHRAELARQEEARLEWDRQFQAQQAQAEELRLARLAETRAAELRGAEQGDRELESTLMTRRQRREKAEATQTPAPTAIESQGATPEKDIWAGPEDRRPDVKPSWSTVGSARAAERQQVTPQRWGTASVWLLTVTPWLGALAAFVALALFPAWSLPAIGVLALPWLIGVLWAQQDSTRLADLGHQRPARALWAMLTAPIYLIVRTVTVRREVGAGSAPLVVWFANALVVAGLVAAVGLMPGALPAYVVTALDPLRETAAAWIGL